jgi:hypothetical protein
MQNRLRRVLRAYSPRTDFRPTSPLLCSAALEVGYGEGFRMPARGDLSARAEGRRPKASQEGTRGPLG